MRQDNGSWLIVSGEKYQQRASAAYAEKRKEKYRQNQDARKRDAEATEFVCEAYGCTRQAATVYDMKRYCSAHAMELTVEDVAKEAVEA